MRLLCGILLIATLACGTDSSPAKTTLPSACTGLVPALTNGSSYTVVGVQPSLPTTCQKPLGDGAGNVFVDAISGTLGTNNQAVYNRTTAVRPNQLTVAALQSGFSGFTAASDGSSHYTGFNPDGSQGHDTVLTGDRSFATQGLNGSGIVSFACAASASTPITFTISLFDDTAALTSTVTFTEAGCPFGGSINIDTSGNVLMAFATGSTGLFGIPANTTALRWFEPVHGTALTGWFDRQGAAGAWFALIGGGLATHYTDGTWKFIPSGKAELDAAPAFLEADKFPMIVEGGKAYAMITGSTGIPDIVAADGTACGPLPSTNISASDSFAIGKDGTLIDTKGDGNCTVTVFPQALH